MGEESSISLALRNSRTTQILKSLSLPLSLSGISLQNQSVAFLSVTTHICISIFSRLVLFVDHWGQKIWVPSLLINWCITFGHYLTFSRFGYSPFWVDCEIFLICQFRNWGVLSLIAEKFPHWWSYLELGIWVL